MDGGRLESVVLQLIADCPTCLAQNPVSRLQAEAPCRACGTAISIVDAVRSIDLEAELHRVLAGEEIRYGQGRSEDGAVALSSFQMWLGEPACVCGGSPGAVADLLPALESVADARCTKCGENLALRGADSLGVLVRGAPLGVAELVGVIGESSAAQASPFGKSVVVQCSNCGGRLWVDGSSRIVACGFCHASEELSDETWNALDHALVKHSLYLLVEPDRRSSAVAGIEEHLEGLALVEPARRSSAVAGIEEHLEGLARPAAPRRDAPHEVPARTNASAVIDPATTGELRRCVAVRLAAGCSNCSAENPVVNLDGSVRCHACSQVFGLQRALESVDLRTALYEAVARGQSQTGRTQTGDGYAVLLSYELTAEEPACFCGAPLGDVDRVMSHVEHGRNATCAQCGLEVSIRRSDSIRAVLHGAAVGVPELRAVVGEALGAESGTRGNPVTLKCSHCGAALQADGTRREVPCQYCQRIERLSDRTWNALKRWTEKRTLYVILDLERERLERVAPSIAQQRAAALDALSEDEKAKRARDPDADPADLAYLASSYQTEAIKVLVAGNPATPKAMLDELVESNYARVRDAVMNRPKPSVAPSPRVEEASIAEAAAPTGSAGESGHRSSSDARAPSDVVMPAADVAHPHPAAAPAGTLEAKSGTSSGALGLVLGLVFAALAIAAVIALVGK